MKDHFTLVKLILNQRCEIKSIVNHKMSTFMSNSTLSHELSFGAEILKSHAFIASYHLVALLITQSSFCPMKNCSVISSLWEDSNIGVRHEMTLQNVFFRKFPLVL